MIPEELKTFTIGDDFKYYVDGEERGEHESLAELLTKRTKAAECLASAVSDYYRPTSLLFYS